MISLNYLKYFIGLFTLTALVIALYIWAQTPELFHYFNQAFCPH